MKETVIIKSYQMNGLKLVMDPEASVEDILQSLAVRLRRGGKFFTAVPKGLFFEGKKLSLQEQKQVLACIRENSELNIVCVIEEDQELQEKINQEVKKACMELKAMDQEKEREKEAERERQKIREAKREKEPTAVDPAALLSDELAMKAGMFYKGNLRSGQVLESDKSIILLGDVKPGAHVTSNGNVLVLGSLQGNVFAGASGNRKAFVVALDMQPVQVRIDDFIARAPDKPEKNRERTPKIAFLEGDNIYIEPISREAFHDIEV